MSSRQKKYIVKEITKNYHVEITDSPWLGFLETCPVCGVRYVTIPIANTMSASTLPYTQPGIGVFARSSRHLRKHSVTELRQAWIRKKMFDA